MLLVAATDLCKALLDIQRSIAEDLVFGIRSRIFIPACQLEQTWREGTCSSLSSGPLCLNPASEHSVSTVTGGLPVESLWLNSSAELTKQYISSISEYLRTVKNLPEMVSEHLPPTIIGIPIGHGKQTDFTIINVTSATPLPATFTQPGFSLKFNQAFYLVSLKLVISRPIAIQAVIGNTHQWLLRLDNSGDAAPHAPLSPFDTLNIFTGGSPVTLSLFEVAAESKDVQGSFVLVQKSHSGGISSMFNKLPTFSPLYDLNYVIAHRLTWKQIVPNPRFTHQDFLNFVASETNLEVRAEIDAAITRAESSGKFAFEISRSFFLLSALVSKIGSPATNDPWAVAALARVAGIDAKPTERLAQVSPQDKSVTEKLLLILRKKLGVQPTSLNAISEIVNLLDEAAGIMKYEVTSQFFKSRKEWFRFFIDAHFVADGKIEPREIVDRLASLLADDSN